MIDINGETFTVVEAIDPSLKCLSARFVIDIMAKAKGGDTGVDAVSNAFRLDS